MKEETRKEIRQKMADYRQPAPEVSWDVLEEALAKNKPARKVPMWPKRVAAAVAVLLLAGLWWQTLKLGNQTNMENTGTEMAQNQPSPTLEKQGNNEGDLAGAEDSRSQSAGEQPETKLIQIDGQKMEKQNPTAGKSILPVGVSTDPETKEQEEDANPDEVKQQVTGNPSQESIVKPHQQTVDDSKQENKTPPTRQRQQTVYPQDIQRGGVRMGKKLTAKVYLSNTLAGGDFNAGSGSVNTNRQSSSVMPMSNPISHDSNGGYFLLGGNPPVTNVQPPVAESIHHSQPVRVGMSVRYPLSERWSVEGGLSYTYLSADITRQVNGNVSKTDQQLSYVGVPVNMNYTLWGNRHLSVYASAGGTVEKMVKGKRTTKDITDGTEGPAHTESVSIRPLQLSVNGAIGAEYHIDQTLSIYAEPGVSYHFDNHSTVPTFYQDKPVGFSVNLGLRLNLNR